MEGNNPLLDKGKANAVPLSAEGIPAEATIKWTYQRIFLESRCFRTRKNQEQTGVFYN